MSRFKCVIVDDEELARELIASHLSQLSDFEVIASCQSAIEASDILQSHSVDLLFLDIEMPVLKGTDFYKNLLNKPEVIFTTAYRDYAIDGFDLDAIDYLLKPIVFARFFKAIEKFRTKRATSSQVGGQEQTTVEKSGATDHLFVRKDRKQIKIVLADVVYVQSLKDYVQIHMLDQTHIVKQPISALAEQLGENFIRVHRSYVVNKNRVSAFTKHDIEIGELEIPIGENYKAAVCEELG